LSLHPAVFYVEGFNNDYYEAHFSDNNERKARFMRAAGLRYYTSGGLEIPTLKEMSNGLNVTYRTAAALVEFIGKEDMPVLGGIAYDTSSRGKNRLQRQLVKKQRQGQFANQSYDCAIEQFILS